MREDSRQADMADRHGHGGLSRLDDRNPDSLFQSNAISRHAGTSHDEDGRSMRVFQNAADLDHA